MSLPDTTFAQHPARCRLEWGPPGATQAAARGDVVVIVDTLSFSSAVATAVEHGTSIYPCSKHDDPAALARTLDATLAVPRSDVPRLGRHSLSPLTYLPPAPPARVVLPSPNGASAARCAATSPCVLAGCLLNASAVAAAVSRLLRADPATRVTIVPAGERWQLPPDEGSTRFAIEDYLAAGAILSALPYDKSAEARICESAFRAIRPADLPSLLRDCASGRELIALGHTGDVDHAARLDAYRSVPVLRHGWFVTD